MAIPVFAIGVLRRTKFVCGSVRFVGLSEMVEADEQCASCRQCGCFQYSFKQVGDRQSVFVMRMAHVRRRVRRLAFLSVEREFIMWRGRCYRQAGIPGDPEKRRNYAREPARSECLVFEKSARFLPDRQDWCYSRAVSVVFMRRERCSLRY